MVDNSKIGKEKQNSSEYNKISWAITEYKECSADWRYRDRQIWTTTPLLLTLSSAFLGVAYVTFSDDLWIRLLVLLFGSIFSLLMTATLVRNRMYRDGSKEQIEKLQDIILNSDIDEYWRNPRIKRAKKFIADPHLKWATHGKGRVTTRILETIAFLISLLLIGSVIHTLAIIIN